MTFPKGYQGVKKLFASEILEVIVTGCIAVGMLILLFLPKSSSPDNQGTADARSIALVIIAAVAIIFFTVANIIRLVGLKQAGYDEPRFNRAFVFSVISLVLSIATNLIDATSLNGGILDTIGGILAAIVLILVMVYTVRGIQAFAEALRRNDLISYGRRILILLVVIYVIIAFTYIIPAFLGSGKTVKIIEEILSVSASVLSLINGIVFIVYLGKAKKMLQYS